MAPASIAAFAPFAAQGATDDVRLGRDRGYPVGQGSWYFDESVRVGSFNHQADIAGLDTASLFGGRANELKPRCAGFDAVAS